MQFIIKHEIKCRVRIHVMQPKMSYREANILQYYLEQQPFITNVKIMERTQDSVICYEGNRKDVLKALKAFDYDKVNVPNVVIEDSGRELNAKYREKLLMKVILRIGRRLFVPDSVRKVCTVTKSIKHIGHGMRCLTRKKLEVPVLDATAIGMSLLRKDFNTASSVMYLLEIGELMEEWTHKKSVGDLARSMSVNVSNVWSIVDGQKVLVSSNDICVNDLVVVHMGNIIPFDGEVVVGEALVNQASLTGESEPVRRSAGNYVYAGTVVEEGELTLCVRENNGSSKFDKIVAMIEETEKMKSMLESKAEHLADRLVPYTFIGAGATWLITRNTTKALAILMVDFSCALKLAMPISVLSAIRELSSYHVVVKGGRFLEVMAEADTIVFDKTGTLTNLYLAIEGILAAVVCIEDPLREEARVIVKTLKNVGIKKVVMMTGDSEKTASAIAREVGIDEYYSEILPEDKARFIEREKKAGRKVVMVGDGINDSPALSAIDVGIAISDGAEIARQIADVTIAGEDLYELVTLKRVSDALVKRIHNNYHSIVGFNSGLIGLGVAGVIQPTASALLHNTYTLVISLKSMENLI